MYIHVPVITCIYNTHICEYQHVCLQHTCIHVCGVHGYVHVHVQLTLIIVTWEHAILNPLMPIYAPVIVNLDIVNLVIVNLVIVKHTYVHKTLSRENSKTSLSNHVFSSLLQQQWPLHYADSLHVIA